ncbi:hypothetical protein VitviT2T_020440 [Vitis vinifera]|uniref:Major facilitator superfamily (MFS) profile domain-containing protein n=4 Tax=Vitis vinifera TaxID=29760 RepID=A0ABY9D4D8_VITVI|nr:hypothetical protein VitviT2T_020440 [Vitis vinifera]
MTKIEKVGSFESKITVYVVVCWVLAACGGLMFGYDIGISGGVTAMDDFLIKFFPAVYQRKLRAKEDNYCKYDNQYLQLFTSSLYLAALVSSFAASKMCSKLGRKPTIFVASAFFLCGSLLSAAAQRIWMIILARVLLGVGVGFGNEAVPLFLSEIAPVQHRGAVNILFQLFITIGILFANLVNYGASKIHPWGWRLSLGLASLPAAFLFVGSVVIIETPASLVERNQESQGLSTLKKIRGVEDVDAEFEQIKMACEAAREVKDPFKTLMKRSSMPPLIIGVMMQVFQQFTGINAIMFYAPVLFQTVGFKNDASLLSSVITGLVNVFSTLVSIYGVDRVGRRKLLLQACVQMFISQTAIGAILLVHLKGSNSLDEGLAGLVVVLVCLFVMSFAWSWGPLGWLIPSETFPLEIRTSGFACAVSSNMLFTFIIAQAFLSMMCHMRAFIFFFFAAWIVAMGLFVLFLLPETKNVPIDAMVERVWKQHPVWKRFMDDYHGGVTAMDDFLIKFFPAVYQRKLRAKEDNYCKYDNQYLQLFTSSLYLAALVSSFAASKMCSKLGRKPTIFVASAFFLCGSLLSAAAQRIWMIILARVLLGVGVGFGNEAVPLFLSEIAPVQHRGAVNILFQLFITIGILFANLVNYGASKIHPWGWRLSLGLASLPAAFLFVGSVVIIETPASLVERNQESQGLSTLKKIRGVEDVDAEFEQIKMACEAAREVKDPFKTLMKRSSMPPLIIGVMMQVFQQFTGINAIMFYAPVLFQTVGFKNDASLLSSVITGLVNVFSTLVSIYGVDRVGRRKLLLQACVQMFISQTAIGAILLVHLKGSNSLDEGLAGLVVVLVCLFVMSFAWSWGPLGWLIPSETFPLEIRTSGFACAVSSNMLFTFIIAQAFLSMMCHMRAFIFFFFAAWIVAMGLFVLFLLPETKNVPIDAMVERVWKQHPVWKRFMDDYDGKEDVKNVGMII